MAYIGGTTTDKPVYTAELGTGLVTIPNTQSNVLHFDNAYKSFVNINVDTTDKLKSVRHHLGKDVLGYTQWGKVVDRFITQPPANGKNHTLWDMTQACTHTFWNSGKDNTKINSWADLQTNEKCVRKLTALRELTPIAES